MPMSGVFRNIDLPPPHRTASVYPPAFGAGEDHRLHIFLEMKQGQCVCPLSWSVHCNFTGDGKCNKRGWACTPHSHQPGPILPSSLNVRQKAAVATLCTLWGGHIRWVEMGGGEGGAIVRKRPDTALYSLYVSTLCCRHIQVHSAQALQCVDTSGFSTGLCSVDKSRSSSGFYCPDTPRCSTGLCVVGTFRFSSDPCGVDTSTVRAAQASVFQIRPIAATGPLWTRHFQVQHRTLQHRHLQVQLRPLWSKHVQEQLRPSFY